MHLIQSYIGKYRHEHQPKTLEPRGLKRKLSHGDSRGQLLTPQSGRSPASNGGTASKSSRNVFNAVLQRREGRLKTVTAGTGWDLIEMLNVRKLPTKEMIEQAQNASLLEADIAVQRHYRSQLRKLRPPVLFRNDIDNESPSLGFKFISEYHLGEGVTRRDELMLGCTKCKPNMGLNRGCEYTQKCDCLEFAAPDLDRMDDEQIAEYNAQLDEGIPFTVGFPKRFPYYNSGSRAGCLVDFYLNQRHPIYECNDQCNCGPRCKNRNVQHGRRVPLEIFRTPKRGFGLRCMVDLKRGEFVDTYLGEVITDEEADRREVESGPSKASYLFSLDKFEGDKLDGVNELTAKDCYVVDGQSMGGPTRFINHRCGDPNLQLHTVSYNKYDYFIYELAFFACRDVPAGEELTFDYMDFDDIQAGESTGLDNDRVKEKADGAKEKVPCLCGSEYCRGYLWS